MKHEDLVQIVSEQARDIKLYKRSIKDLNDALKRSEELLKEQREALACYKMYCKYLNWELKEKE